MTALTTKMILDEILKHEKVSHFSDLSLERVKEFQDKQITKTVEFESDSDFDDFMDELKKIFKESRVYHPTAVKILTNAYIMCLEEKNQLNT